MLKGIQILDISKNNFRKYGCVIEYPSFEKKGHKRNLWKIVHRSSGKTGWRIAYLVLRDKSIGRLECHPDSDEVFDPVRGKAIIFVSESQDASTIKAFYLDKPVVIYEGIWHGLVSLGKEAHIKIFENADVECNFYKLKTRLDLNKWMQRKRRER